MERGIFESMWNPYYRGAYAYSRRQPRARYNYRPRAPVYEQYGSPMEPEDRSPYTAEEPVKENSVKTIPVTDGRVPVAVSQKENSQTVEPVKSPVKPVVTRFVSEDAAATKIQAVYRGYAVHKTEPLKQLREIKKVRDELESYKRKLQDPEQKKKLCSDPKDRLRWTEGIMMLLLRLDSLQGMHPDVRVIRKELAKEVIRFQETIDSMASESTELNRQEDVVTAENNNSSDVAKEKAEVMEKMNIEKSTPKKSSGVDQDVASGGATEVCVKGDSDGQGIKATENSTSH